MKSTKAVEIFNSGFNCAQSVVSVFADDYGIGKDELLRLSSGLGGGMGGMQEICGAATGAYLILGLQFGYSSESENYRKTEVYDIVKEFSKEFVNKNSYLKCKDLLKCDLSTENGKDYFMQNNLKEKICSVCVKSAVELTEKFIQRK